MEKEPESLITRLISAFKVLYAAIDGARVEERSNCRLFVCPSVPIPMFNAIWAVEESPDRAVGGLGQAAAEVENLGLPFGVLYRAAKAPDLEAAAQRLGLTAVEHIPAMVMAANELRDRGAAGIRIVRVRRSEDLDSALSVMAAGFEVPAALLQAVYTPAIAEVPGVSIYLGSVDGEPVSTAVALARDGGVGIFNVATPPSLRGRGYGAAVTARAAEDGFATGANVAWLQSSELGEPVYRRMGFRQVDTHVLLTRPLIGQ